MFQNIFFGNPNFGIVSITINPENDTPEVLKEHANKLGVKSSNWHFLTGDKTKIFDLANKGFNVASKCFTLSAEGEVSEATMHKLADHCCIMAAFLRSFFGS